MKTQEILEAYAPLGVELLKTKVAPFSATGKTVASIHSVVSENRLQIFARGFFESLETGRGPRKSSSKSGFEDSMLEWMRARGIGADLPEKKRKQLARFFTWRANKEGDKTFQTGGRQVYSDALEKYVAELMGVLSKEFAKEFVISLRNTWQSP